MASGWPQSGVTGGAGGTAVTVSDYASVRAACRAAVPLMIRAEGTIMPTGETYCYIEGYDKTIVGVGTNSGLVPFYAQTYAGHGKYPYKP